ncbi:MAG: hypothetical protein BMS9Abin09_0550 [Gammaproteobacteria bacterium]|nr:MAG: hypothetical protein BMS9Abin09_0550 [Gammaproteobacteria bacterium]
MKKFSALLLWLLLSQVARAHHTKDHMMLSEDAAQVIAATREGSGGDWIGLIWAAVTILLLLGFIRWWYNRK